ncbi:hypothetical protein GPECTOR_48g425 [Gonium pectorale]|uniref:HYR domain-containing protein n=1 Tax=Gonium pectorale TaxID=33097 RepID=A0A150G8A0_GONPE|nr:hypothetical protein GPECTOR_48g425 [Gonium pectorale]|eukprot:KXZ45993.1 hypothetical protein GPECTOR_48g425 [Gonium pectorale]
MRDLLKGSHGKGSHGKGSHGKGSHGKGSHGKTDSNFMMETCVKTAAPPSVCGSDPSPCGDAGAWLSCTPATNPMNGRPSWSDWSCTCAPGFYFNVAQRKCLPANCATGKNPCGVGGTCSSINATAYRCTCARGYFFDAQAKACLGSSAAYESCTSIGGTTYSCVCKSDYFHDAKRNTCVITNPCANPDTACGGAGKYTACVPFNQTHYTCNCTAGNYFDNVLGICKADPCAASPSPCGPSNTFSTCAARSTAPFYSCTCRSGFTFNGTSCTRGATTADAGACSTNPCGASTRSSRCTNLPGATPPYVCSCKSPSFLYDAGVSGGTCVASSCVATPNPCGAPGAYTTCSAASARSNDFTCDLCAAPVNPCGTGATCTSISGQAYTCQCPGGQSFDPAAKRCASDSMPSVLNTPTSIVAEATSRTQGAQVMYDAKAFDLVAGAITPTCKPESGSWFPLTGNGVGTWVVCSAEDAARNRVTRSFRVRVVKLTPPIFQSPMPLLVERAVDFFGNAVTCTATDAVGLTSEASFTTTVSCMTSPSPLASQGNYTGTRVEFDQSASTLGGIFPLTQVQAYTEDWLMGVGFFLGSGSNETLVYNGTPYRPQGAQPKLVNLTLNAGETIMGLSVFIDTCWEVPGTIIVPDNFTVEAPLDSGANVPYTITTTNDASATSPPTPPVFEPDTLPNVEVTASSPQGAVVAFPAFTASDVHSGPPLVACSPASNSFFPVGITTVNCTARDRAGVTASRGFTVTVLRNESFPEPTLTVPGDLSYEVIPGASARIIEYEVTASQDLPFTCTPPSGSSLGPSLVPTEVICKVDGYSTEYKFNVHVWASAPPYFEPALQDLVVSANHPRGAIIVGLPPMATDDHAASPPFVECNVPSDSIFPHGVTAVECVATDGVGLQTTVGFSVTVQYPCLSDPSPCGPRDAYIDCNPVGLFDFTCVCQAGYLQDNSGVCTRDALCLTAGGATVSGRTMVTMAGMDPNGAPDQRFYVRPVFVVTRYEYGGVATSTRVGYALSPVQQPTKCLSVLDASALDGQEIVLSDCLRLGQDTPPMEQVFGLPLSDSTALTGNMLMPYNVTMKTNVVVMGANGKPTAESLRRFHTAFKSEVASALSASFPFGTTPFSSSAVNLLAAIIDGTVDVEFGDAIEYRRSLNADEPADLEPHPNLGGRVPGRSLLQSDDTAPILTLAVNFTLTWPVSEHPPIEGALEEVLTAKVTPHFDTSKPVIVTDGLQTIWNTSGPGAVGVAVQYSVAADDDFYIDAPVDCRAQDGSGNYELLSFNVEVQQPL